MDLKVGHIRLVAYHLKNIVAENVFDTLAELKAKTVKDEDEDNIKTVTIKTKDFMFALPLIAMSPEIESASTNKEIENLLMPQIQAGTSEGDEEWIALGQFFAEQKASARQRQSAKKQAGENFLHPE